jgi:uncharacterized membrane protein YgcG
MIFAIIIAAVGFISSPASGQDFYQDERILYYGSDITIDTSGVVFIKETIKVRSLSIDIQHGIYRSIPTKYRGKFLEQVVTPLEVTRVTRDGVAEPYRIAGAENGIHVYIGDEDVTLPPGEYVYTIEYNVDLVIGFSNADYDELYWNVTGSGWSFAIDSVYAIVRLPKGGSIVDGVSAYSGAEGETDSNCAIKQLSSSSVEFRTTSPLSQYEGLTVAVPFEKGLIKPPSKERLKEQFISDNYPAVAGLIGLMLVLAYYFLAWLYVGKDPKGRITMPRFEPPQNLTPYEVRYIKNMKFDNRVMAAALVSMAQKGLITINETERGKYKLTRETGLSHSASDVEKKLLGKLFPHQPTLELGQSYNPAFKQAVDELREYLKKNFSNSAFKLNRPWLTIGVLASACMAIYSMLQQPFDSSLPGLFMLLWLTGWTFACVMLVRGLISLWKDRKFVQCVFMLIFVIPFLAAEFFALFMLLQIVSFYLFLCLVALAIVNVIFFEIMKAPTAHGRLLLDEIEGFSQFLHTADLSRTDRRLTGPMDLRLFEQYFPYALALDLHTEWANHFENQLNESPEYQPGFRWYRGFSSHRSLGSFSSSFNQSLSSTISSSRTPPSSSSGSGGSGSSGGGGGGGGGGGW